MCPYDILTSSLCDPYEVLMRSFLPPYSFLFSLVGIASHLRTFCRTMVELWPRTTTARRPMLSSPLSTRTLPSSRGASTPYLDGFFGLNRTVGVALSG